MSTFIEFRDGPTNSDKKVAGIVTYSVPPKEVTISSTRPPDAVALAASSLEGGSIGYVFDNWKWQGR